jgi:hypothetical protein
LTFLTPDPFAGLCHTKGIKKSAAIYDDSIRCETYGRDEPMTRKQLKEASDHSLTPFQKNLINIETTA